jgi:citrate synthase
MSDVVVGVVARTLGIPEQSVVDDLAYAAIPQWDSLNHVNLMVALEQAFETEIDENLMVELTTVKAIRAFARRVAPQSA